MLYPAAGFIRAPASEKSTLPVELSQKSRGKVEHLQLWNTSPARLAESLPRSSAWGQLPKCSLSSIPGLPPAPAPLPQPLMSSSHTYTTWINCFCEINPDNKITFFRQTHFWPLLPAAIQNFPLAAASGAHHLLPQVTYTAATSRLPYPQLLGFTSQFSAIPLDGDEGNYFDWKTHDLHRDGIVDPLDK